jgi:hypothetical protein
VPSGLGYVSGTLHASSGAWDDALAPTLTWSGVLTPTPVITITYVSTVTVATSRAIENMATLVVPNVQLITRTATVIANPFQVYLPAIARSWPATGRQNRH